MSPAEKLVAMLAQRFTWGRNEDQSEALTSDILEACEQLQSIDVEPVVKKLVATRPYRSMPTVKEILDAWQAVLGERLRSAFTDDDLKARKSWETKMAEATRFADRYLAKAPLAQQAIAEKWERSLHSMVKAGVYGIFVEDGKLPEFDRFVDRFKLHKTDIEYLRKHGQSYVASVRDWILAGRPKGAPHHGNAS